MYSQYVWINSWRQWVFRIHNHRSWVVLSTIYIKSLYFHHRISSIYDCNCTITYDATGTSLHIDFEVKTEKWNHLLGLILNNMKDKASWIEKFFVTYVSFFMTSFSKLSFLFLSLLTHYSVFFASSPCPPWEKVGRLIWHKKLAVGDVKLFPIQTSWTVFTENIFLDTVS